MIALLASTLAAYLIGSVPFGIAIARWAGGVDPRRAGSRSTGATNVGRIAGTAAGLATLALDVAKGAAAVALARAVAGPPAATWAAVAAVVGHVAPPWLRGGGGKGVATAAGALAALAPAPAAAAISVFGVVVLWKRFVSLASLIAAAAFPAAAVLLGSSGRVVVSGLAIAGVIGVRHRDNLARLRAGTEPRIGRSGAGTGT